MRNIELDVIVFKIYMEATEDQGIRLEFHVRSQEDSNFLESHYDADSSPERQDFKHTTAVISWPKGRSSHSHSSLLESALVVSLQTALQNLLYSTLQASLASLMTVDEPRVEGGLLHKGLVRVLRERLGPVLRTLGKVEDTGFRKLTKIGKGLALLQGRLQRHAGYNTISNSKLTKALLSDFSLSALTRLTRSFQAKLKSTAFERIRLVGNWQRTIRLVLGRLGLRSRDRDLKAVQKAFYLWERTGRGRNVRQLAVFRLFKPFTSSYLLKRTLGQWCSQLAQQRRSHLKRIKAGLIGLKLNALVSSFKRQAWGRVRWLAWEKQRIARKLSLIVDAIKALRKGYGLKEPFSQLQMHWKRQLKQRAALRRLTRLHGSKAAVLLARHVYKFYHNAVLCSLDTKRKVWKHHQSFRLLRLAVTTAFGRTVLAAFLQLRAAQGQETKKEKTETGNLQRSTKLVRALYRFRGCLRLASKEAISRWSRLLRPAYLFTVPLKTATSPTAATVFQSDMELYESPGSRELSRRGWKESPGRLSASAGKRVARAKAGMRIGKGVERLIVGGAWQKVRAAQPVRPHSLLHKSNFAHLILTRLLSLPLRLLRSSFQHLRYPFLSSLPVLEALLHYRRQVARHTDLHFSLLKWRQYMREWRLKERKRAVVVRHALGKLGRRFEAVEMSWAFYTLQQVKVKTENRLARGLKVIFPTSEKARFRLLLDAYRYFLPSKWSQCPSLPHRRSPTKSIHHKRSSGSTASTRSVTSASVRCLECPRSSRILPLPGSIHDYIDDVVEVGRDRSVEASYSTVSSWQLEHRRAKGCPPRPPKACKSCGQSLAKSTKGSDGIGSDKEDLLEESVEVFEAFLR